MGERITQEEFSAREAARYNAEKPIRDALKAKKSKIVKELVDLGLSQNSAKFLVGLSEEG
jgi:hypothetical protein